MKNYLSIMRLSHWSKNIFVFVGLMFGGKLSGPIDEVFCAVGSAIGGFLCFSLAASAGSGHNLLIAILPRSSAAVSGSKLMVSSPSKGKLQSQ